MITYCMPCPPSSTTTGRRAGHAYLERSRPLLSHTPSATTGGTQSVTEPHLMVGRHLSSDPASRLTRSLAGPRDAVIQEVGTYSLRAGARSAVPRRRTAPIVCALARGLRCRDEERHLYVASASAAEHVCSGDYEADWPADVERESAGVEAWRGELRKAGDHEDRQEPEHRGQHKTTNDVDRVVVVAPRLRHTSSLTRRARRRK